MRPGGSTGKERRYICAKNNKTKYKGKKPTEIKYEYRGKGTGWVGSGPGMNTCCTCYVAHSWVRTNTQLSGIAQERQPHIPYEPAAQPLPSPVGQDEENTIVNDRPAANARRTAQSACISRMR